MDLDLLLSTEFSQFDNELSDVGDCYEISDDYETTDNEHSNNKSLNSDQSKRLNDELSARSKWRIDQERLCIHSLVCEIYTDKPKQ
ncbi:7547_t:CDS:2, partial [Dentiscutata erythropus]